MINIAFLGNKYISDEIKSLLSSDAIPTTTTKADIFILSVDSANDLINQPKRFDKPTILYIKKNDPNLISIIKNYNFSGILTASISKENLIKKIMTIPGMESNKNIDELEILKSKILAKAENIPPLPVVAQELLKLTRSDETSLKLIIEKIKTDQGISSKVLKLINSPFYALRKEISSIDQASMLLGTTTIKNIVLSISIEEFYKKNFSLYKTTGNELWQHSHDTAVIAEFLGKKCKLDPDACYLSGLMHDVGKIVLVDFLLKEVDDYNDEKKLTGTTHQEIASVILSKWGVNKDIINAVLEHHNLSDNIFEKVLYYSNQISHNMNDEGLFETIKKELKIKIDDLLSILEHFRDSKHE